MDAPTRSYADLPTGWWAHVDTFPGLTCLRLKGGDVLARELFGDVMVDDHGSLLIFAPRGWEVPEWLPPVTAAAPNAGPWRHEPVEAAP